MAMILTTTPSVEGRKIVEYKGELIEARQNALRELSQRADGYSIGNRCQTGLGGNTEDELRQYIRVHGKLPACLRNQQ